VVSWTTLKDGEKCHNWICDFGIGASAGVYGESHRASNQLRDKINVLAKASCLTSRKPNGVYEKYNDLVSSIMRTEMILTKKFN